MGDDDGGLEVLADDAPPGAHGEDDGAAPGGLAHAEEPGRLVGVV